MAEDDDSDGKFSSEDDADSEVTVADADSNVIVAAAVTDDVEVLFDTGAAVNLFSTSFGHNIYDGPPVNILAVGGNARLTKCFDHPLFGISYFDPNRRVNVVCAHRILTDSSKFRVWLTLVAHLR